MGIITGSLAVSVDAGLVERRLEMSAGHSEAWLDRLAGLALGAAGSDGALLAICGPAGAGPRIGKKGEVTLASQRFEAWIAAAEPSGPTADLSLRPNDDASAFGRAWPIRRRSDRPPAALLLFWRSAEAAAQALRSSPATARQIEDLVALAGERLELEDEVEALIVEHGEHRAALKASRDTEALLIDYLMAATDGVWQTDENHKFVSTTTDLASLHISLDRVYGKTIWGLAGADPDREPHWTAFRATLEAHRPVRGFEYVLHDDQGRDIWREVNANPVVGPDGEFRGYRGTSRDITDRKRAEAALREMNSRLAALAGSGIVGIVVGESDWIIEANPEFLRIIGAEDASPDDSRIHRSRLMPGTSQIVESALRRELEEQGVWGPLERDVLRMDGTRVPALVSSIMLDRDRDRWMCLVQDISERKQAEARIRELADCDTLTGLLNRRSFMERFAAMLESGPAAMGGGALILIDLDHFKDVNDTLGHDAGDALLCEVATRLSRSLRHNDAVARLGGDEFAVLLSGIVDTTEVEAIARRILEQLRRPFVYDARLLHANASAGIVVFPTDGTTAKQLLKNADIALYRSKARGRRTVNFFDSYMLAEYEDRLALDTELQRALAEHEFALAFQPTIRLEDRSHAGFEALLRWNHPTRGLLAPASFVANLEQSGLIVAVGRFVLETAFRQLRAWLDSGFEPGHVAVNVASAQLRQGELVREVERLLALYCLDPRRLRVEITENVLLEDSPEIAVTLEGLHRLGVEIALDDFGTGFASLSHLKRVPVDVLKIDRSFVRDIGIDADDAAISRTIITLAHSLGMAVVAEGVTTEEALSFLRLNGCDEAQGYLFSRPLPAEHAITYLGTMSLALHQD